MQARAMGRRGRAPRILAAAVATSILVGACTGGEPDTVTAAPGPGDALATGAGSVRLGNLRVELPRSRQPVSVTAPTLTADQYGGLRDWLQSGAFVGAPVEISAEGDFSGQSVRLTREYAVPLPPDAVATLAYYEPALGAWLAVPSEVSADRRSVTAQVGHLSLWDDFVATTQQAGQGFRDGLQRGGQAVRDAASSVYDGAQKFSAAVGKGLAGAGNEMYYAVGKVFDVRVDPPGCDGAVPDWVDSAVTIAADKNNPVLWCTGRDPKRPDLLVVKARINRGFALFAQPAAGAAWSWNSTFDQSAFDAALAAVTELDSVMAQSVAALTGPGIIAGAGQEISFGFSEEQARRVPIGRPLMNLAVPEPLPFLATAVAQLAVQQGVDMVDGLLASIIAVASCSKDVAAATDVLAGARAVLTCIGPADEAIAKKVGVALLRKGMEPRAAGQLAGRLVGKVSLALGLIGPAFNAMNYIAESNTSPPARSVTVFLRAPRPSTRSAVATAEGFGPVRLGMSATEATAAAGAGLVSVTDTSPSCTVLTYRTPAGDATALVVPPGGAVTQIYPPDGTRTDRGIGTGSTTDAVRAAYGSDHSVTTTDTQGGPALYVTTGNPGDVGYGNPGGLIGFPLEGDTVSGPPVIGGVPGFEYCSG